MKVTMVNSGLKGLNTSHHTDYMRHGIGDVHQLLLSTFLSWRWFIFNILEGSCCMVLVEWYRYTSFPAVLYIIQVTVIIIVCPADTRRWPNVRLLLGRRRRRWPNINPTLGQRIVSAGHVYNVSYQKYHNKEVMICRWKQRCSLQRFKWVWSRWKCVVNVAPHRKIRIRDTPFDIWGGGA